MLLCHPSLWWACSLLIFPIWLQGLLCSMEYRDGRWLRADQVDQHYCHTQLKYTRERVIEWTYFSPLLCSDDKVKVSLGEPGVNIKTGANGKKSIAPVGAILSAFDHDMNKYSLTSSIYTQFWSQHNHCAFQLKFSIGDGSWTLDPS